LLLSPRTIEAEGEIVTHIGDLKNLLQQKTWDKEVVLWLGSERTLRDTLSNHSVQVMDLLDLFDSNSLPADDDDTRVQLTAALRRHLQELNATARSKIVLIVRSGGLLARYNLGLREFYDWFCGDFGMVIITLDHSADDLTWPETVVFEKDRLYNYFTEPGMCSRVFTHKG
jgi:hypothetical protein